MPLESYTGICEGKPREETLPRSLEDRIPPSNLFFRREGRNAFLSTPFEQLALAELGARIMAYLL